MIVKINHKEVMNHSAEINQVAEDFFSKGEIVFFTKLIIGIALIAMTQFIPMATKVIAETIIEVIGVLL